MHAAHPQSGHSLHALLTQQQGQQQQQEQQRIPWVLWQTYRTRELPHRARMAQASWQGHNPDLAMHLETDEEAEKFIATTFDDDTLKVSAAAGLSHPCGRGSTNWLCGGTWFVFGMGGGCADEGCMLFGQAVDDRSG